MQNTVIFFALVVVLTIGQFPLQYFFSTRESKWPGYLLPVLNILSGVAAGPLLAGVIFFVINVLIYRVGRDKVRRRLADRVDKMNIQDLG